MSGLLRTATKMAGALDIAATGVIVRNCAAYRPVGPSVLCKDKQKMLKSLRVDVDVDKG